MEDLPLPGLVVDFTLSDHSHLIRAETTLETTPVTTSACHMKFKYLTHEQENSNGKKI